MTNSPPTKAATEDEAIPADRERNESDARFHPGPPVIFTAIGCLLLLVLIVAHWRTVESSAALFQIKAGDVIYNTGEIPNRDIFSAASRVDAWVFFEWLWSMGASAAYRTGELIVERVAPVSLHRLGGWIGISVVNVVLAALTYGLLVFRLRNRGSGLLVALSVTVLTGVALLPGFQPEAAYAVLPLYVLSLIITEARSRLPMVLFAPLVALWANMHGSVVVAFIAPLASLLLPAPAQSGETRRKLYLAVIIAAGVVALFLNPHSVRIVPALWDLARVQAAGGASGLGAAVLDMSFIIRLALAAVFFLLALATRRLTLRDGFSIVILGVALCVLSSETVNFLLLYLSAPAARAITQLLAGTWQINRVRYLAASATLLLCVGWAAMTVFSARLTPDAWGAGIRPRVFPETAAGRLAAIPLRATILNLSDDGGYLSWRLWPTWKVAADNRMEVYEPGFFDRYEDIWLGRPGWPAYLSLWRVHAVLGNADVSNRYPSHNLYYELATSEEWAAVYWDRQSILYLKSDIELASTNLSEFRQLKPGLPWNEMTALLQTPEEWREFKADLRRALIDDPGNAIAQEFLRRAESQN